MKGTVTISLKDTKKFEHLGIKCYLVGYLCTILNTQKYFPTRISARNLPLSRKSWNLQASSLKTRSSTSSSRTSRKNTKPSKALLVESDTSSGWLLPENSVSSKKSISLFCCPMRKSKEPPRSSPWKWRSASRTASTSTSNTINLSTIWRTSSWGGSTSTSSR